MSPRHLLLFLFFLSPLVASDTEDGTPRAARVGVPPISGNMAIDDATERLMTQRVVTAIEHAIGGGIPRVTERLNFLQEQFSNLDENETLRDHLGLNDGDISCVIETPSVEQLTARNNDAYRHWRRAHLLAHKKHCNYQGNDASFERTGRWKQYEDRLMQNAQHRHARQQVYNQRLTEALRQRNLGTQDEQTTITLVNQTILPAMIRDQAEDRKSVV